MALPVPVKTIEEGLLKPFGDLIRRLCGPAFDQYGLAWADHVTVWRIGRLARLCEKVKANCEKAGISPQRVKYSLLKNITEAASIEEDDDLQDLWGNLLSNAADPFGNEILPAFTEILKQISKGEALFLNAVFIFMTNRGTEGDNSPEVYINSVQYDNLRRLGLLSIEYERRIPTAATLDGHALSIALGETPEERVLLSDLGCAFVRACRAPKAA
jgi:hypothetical protein